MSNLSEEKMVSKYGHTTITLDSEDIEKLLQGKELYNTDIDEYSFSVVAEEPVPLIPLAKVKQAREKLDEMSKYTSVTGDTHYKQLNRDDVLAILDSLIEESEEK